MLELNEIMKLDIMKGAKILSGKKNLNNKIRSVSVLEIPEATPFIKDSELLISAFYSIRTDIKKQIEVIKMLKNVGASGLILSHVGLILDRVSQELIDICKELDFPLILAPADLAYIDIISPIMDTLLYNHNKELKQTLKIYDIMSETIIDKQDPTNILETLYDLINRPILYFDCNKDCVFQKSIDKEREEVKSFIIEQINNNFNTFLDKKDVYINHKDDVIQWLLTPIISNFRYYGILAIFLTKKLNDLDWIAINQTKNFISIVTLNNINRRDYKISVKKEFIIDLISKEPVNEEMTIKRGLGLGYNIDLLKLAIVIDIYDFNSLSENRSEYYLIQLKKDIFQTVENNISMKSNEYIIIDYSDKIILLLYKDIDEKTTKEKALKISNYLIEKIKTTNKIDVSIGIGKYYEKFKYIYKSYNEAQTAIKISNKLFSVPQCTSYNEIEIYHSILENADFNWVNKIIKELFGKLIEYDNVNDSELLYTLIKLLENNLNTKMTAKELFIHKNTIAQRKNKIIEILEVDPFTYPNITKYTLAALLYKYFHNNFLKNN